MECKRRKKGSLILDTILVFTYSDWGNLWKTESGWPVKRFELRTLGYEPSELLLLLIAGMLFLCLTKR